MTLDEPVVLSKPQSLSPNSLQALHKYRTLIYSLHMLRALQSGLQKSMGFSKVLEDRKEGGTEGGRKKRREED